MKKPFLANFEVNFKNNIQGSTLITETLEESDPDESIAFGMTHTATLEDSDSDESIYGFTQRTRTTEDSDVDESISF